MRHTITQEDSVGCGAACVAFVVGTTYRQVVKILGQQKARSEGFQLKEIVDVLGVYGFNYHYRYVKPHVKPLIYQEGVIVFIKRSAKYPYGHYLSRHDGRWVDPWINFVIDNSIENARSGYRQRLPGKVQWVILPVEKQP